MSNPWLFLRRFVNCPRAVGSVLPSSRYLVKSMVTGINWKTVGSVAELGAGTGVITDAIDHSRAQQSRFLCFERDEDMRRNLRDRYRSITVCDDAFALRSTLEEERLPGLDCVVSGLPLFNFSDSVRRSLLVDIHRSLNPGGVFVAFQYTRLIKPFLVSIYDDMETQFVWANLPPAFVYLCKKPV